MKRCGYRSACRYTDSEVRNAVATTAEECYGLDSAAIPATYRILHSDAPDRRRLEISLLMALLSFIVLTFVVFPELVTRMASGDDEVDRIEIPVFIQPLPQEEPRERTPQKRQEQIRNQFSAIPEIAAPGAGESIAPDLPSEELLVRSNDVEGFEFGSAGDPPLPPLVAGDIQPPVVSFTAPLPYPQKARILRRQGLVRLLLIIRKDGTHTVVRILEETPADQGFGEAARQYLQSSHWRPALQNGRPLDVQFVLTIRFSLKS